MKRWLYFAAISAALLTGVVLLWVFVLSPRVRGEIFRVRVRARLESVDPALRREAARSIADKPDPFLVTHIAQAIYGDETDAGVAAAFVTALGEIGDPQQLAAVRFATESHQPGEVRAAAWLALARLNPAEFQTLAPASSEVDAWNALGIAQARLTLGDPSGVDVLLHNASGDDPARATIASHVLNEHLRPLLIAIGQWPLESSAPDAWTADLTTHVASRLAGLDLAALAADSRRTAAAAEPIRSTLERISNARDRIESWLTDPNNHRWIP